MGCETKSYDETTSWGLAIMQMSDWLRYVRATTRKIKLFVQLGRNSSLGLGTFWLDYISSRNESVSIPPQE